MEEKKENGMKRFWKGFKNFTGSTKFKNFGSRALSVIGAVLIWFYAMSMDSPTSTKDFSNIQISLENVSRMTQEYGFSVLSGYDVTCDMTLYGKKSDLNRLSRDSVKAYVDLVGVNSAGSAELEVKASLPNGITLAYCYPERISVYVDKTTTKTIPVKVNETFTKSADIVIETPTLNYSSITVSGPTAELEKIDHARLSVDLGNVTRSVDASGKISLINTDGVEVSNPYVRCNVTDVTASFPVYKYKNLGINVDTRYKYLDSNHLSLDINPGTIRVRGEPDIIDTYDSITAVTIDEKQMTDTSMSYSVSLKLPDGIERADGSSDALVPVTIDATLVDLYTKTLAVNLSGGVTVVKPESGRDFALLTSNLYVRIRGEYVSVNLAAAQDLNMILDISGYNNGGTYSVPLTVEFKNESGQLFVIGSYSVEVIIL